MTINYEQVRRENDILKTDNIQLRTKNDAMKDENKQLKVEISQLKSEVDIIKAENIVLKACVVDASQSLHPSPVPQKRHTLKVSQWSGITCSYVLFTYTIPTIHT